jgi:hypothetical protein
MFRSLFFGLALFAGLVLVYGTAAVEFVDHITTALEV